MARPHRMAHKFLKLAHKERDLDPEATKIVSPHTPDSIMW